jgi:hypothetical protein
MSQAGSRQNITIRRKSNSRFVCKNLKLKITLILFFVIFLCIYLHVIIQHYSELTIHGGAVSLSPQQRYSGTNLRNHKLNQVRKFLHNLVCLV